jgi:cytochrome c oxidase subunit IV
MVGDVHREHEAGNTDAVHEHPGPKKYLMIMLILGILTGIEVAVFYIEALAPVLVPTLLVLTTGKFALVVMYYMHLKFDSRLFSWVFVAPLILTMAVVVSLIILFHVLPRYQ